MVLNVLEVFRRLMPRRVLQCSLMLATIAGAGHAQAAPATAADSVFARARLLVAGGNGAAGRVLVDSMVTVATPGTPAYAEALYWRASLAATSADGEADFHRIIAEYPLSPRSADALLQLAQLEAARGDRDAAITHLERFLMENPGRPDRPRTALQLVRLSFEQNEPQIGCVFLARVLSEVPDSDVELRNQMTYYSPRCAAVDTTHAAGAVIAAASDSAGAKPDSAAAKAKYTLQIAAYTSRADADHLVQRLKARGIEARIVGTAKLFRVRVGRYATRSAAAAAQRELKTKKIDAFVTDIGTEDKK
jgi:tetratricopeptide (TPR) repeat protein